MTKSADHPQETLRLDGFLPYRLSVLSNAVSRKIADMYEREFDISIWQWRIIAVLGESDGLTSTEVANRTLMDKPAVSRAAASLTERNIISRKSDDADRSFSEKLTKTSPFSSKLASTEPLMRLSSRARKASTSSVVPASSSV